MHYFQIELYDYGRGLMTSSLVLLMMEELGGCKPFPVLSKTYSLMGNYNASLSVDAKIMVSTNCPIVGERVAVNFVAQ